MTKSRNKHSNVDIIKDYQSNNKIIFNQTYFFLNHKYFLISLFQLKIFLINKNINSEQYLNLDYSRKYLHENMKFLISIFIFVYIL